MASTMFNKGKQKLLDAAIDLNDGDVRAMLVRSTYTFDATDEFISDLGSVDNGRSAQLANTTVTDGTFDADNTSITATSAVACDKLVLFIHTGSDATAPLICSIDINAFTPSASQAITVTWDDGANKIFRWAG